jgi:protein-tyrosine-phosphatase
MPKPFRILMVCLGNICRSPLAEGAMQAWIDKLGLRDRFQVDSAGTAGYHVGERPDPRSVQVAKAHGISLNHAARQFSVEDFYAFDAVLVMDRSNYNDVLRLARHEGDRMKVSLLASHEPSHGPSVLDPYYGELSGFEEVYQQVSACSQALLEKLIAEAP